jgi:arylsulfatase A-like enzyme
MTGRYPRHHGVRWNGSSLDENEITLVDFLKERGYQTASIGKHHVSQRRFVDALDHSDASGLRRNWKERPDGVYDVAPEEMNPFERYVQSRGFEYRTGYALPSFRRNLGAVPSNLPEDCHLDAYVGMRCREYLSRVDVGAPFFLWLGFYGPHHPYVPSGRFAQMYDPDLVPPFHRAEQDIEKKPVEYLLYTRAPDHKFRGFDKASEETFRRMKAAYYGMVSQIDWQVGLVLDELTKRGLIEDTIVVFTSDHGEFLGDHGIPAKAPFLLDCMLHVPCFIRLPDSISGTRCDSLVESVDLFPTLTSLAGFGMPQWVHGQDLSPLLSGEAEYESRRAIYAEAVDKRCIRTQEWKYIHYPGKDRGELYDLVRDPHELDNLYAECPDVVKRLRNQFYALLDATEDFYHPKYQRFSGQDPDTGEKVTHYHTW